MSDVNPTDGQPPVIEVGLAFATVQDAARQLGVPVTFLRREVKAGRVPSIRMGSSVRVNVRAVKAALERQAAGEYADSLFGQLSVPFARFRPFKGDSPDSLPGPCYRCSCWPCNCPEGPLMIRPAGDGGTIPPSEKGIIAFEANPRVGGTPGTV